jgi:KUP system potassium uptake protein
MSHHRKTPLTLLALGALGVVYGDLGTSPLYTMNEVFFGGGDLPVTAMHALGAASLAFWILVVVVGVKYAGLVLKADHHGEGGMFALFSLFKQETGRHITVISFLLMFSAGLLLGDGVITPAISVLSAVEGLKVAWPSLAAAVVPLTIVLLTATFVFQRFGTRRIGQIYGPVMLLWFITIAWLGLRQLLPHPDLLLTVINPLTAWRLIASLDFGAIMLLLGGVFLTATGGEALYADLGHFGKRAIRVGWFFIVFPALVLSYAGQGAYVAAGQAVRGGNLFYSLTPSGWEIPLVILATCATIIASVGIIFGAYSLVSQAIVLNILPRLSIRHTNEETEGQIYIPAVNWSLYVGSVSMVLLFGSSARLAAAFGFAVSGVMFITSAAMATVAIRFWHWPKTLAVIFFGPLAIIDLIFFIANSAKFLRGGYIPCAIGIGLFIVIYTWRWGRRIMRTAYDAYVEDRDMAWFLDLKRRVSASGFTLSDHHKHRIVEEDRAVIFLISRPIANLESRVPVKLRVYIKRRGSIPKDMVLLHIEQTREPYTHHDQYEIKDLGENVLAIHAKFGFMENPNVAKLLRDLYRRGLFEKQFERCSVETSEDEFIIDSELKLSTKIRAHLLKLLSRYSTPRYRYFGFRGGASAGLSKTMVPVHLSRLGIRVEVPEFTLRDEGGEAGAEFAASSTPYVPF